MSSSDAHHQPGLSCWRCQNRFSLEEVLKDGILRARSDRDGGPFRLFLCRFCQEQNLCEKTVGKRWFASPTFQPNLLDFLAGKLGLIRAGTFLRTLEWYRDHEERRRYFFERDGDRRYSGGLLPRLLFPLGEAPEPDREVPPRARPGAGPGSSAESSAGGKKGERSEEKRAPRPAPPRPPSPEEILGVARGASETEIRRAFHRLAVQYHPDKVHHLGEEFVAMAQVKFKELQAAYEELLRSS